MCISPLLTANNQALVSAKQKGAGKTASSIQTSPPTRYASLGGSPAGTERASSGARGARPDHSISGPSRCSARSLQLLSAILRLRNLSLSDIHAPSRERENAARQLEKMLRAHDCNTNLFHDNPDLNEVLKQPAEALEEADRARSARNAAPPPMPPAVPLQPPPGAPANAEQLFHTICGLLQRYVYFRLPEYPIAAAIWIMYTHVFEKLPITRQLRLTFSEDRSGLRTSFLSKCVLPGHQHGVDANPQGSHQTADPRSAGPWR
jgi:hypothetical protein